MKHECLVVFTALSIAACAANPTGKDVAEDIKAYAYENVPRLATPDEIGSAGDPFHSSWRAMRFTAGSGGAAIASSDFPWRIPKPCRGDYRTWLSSQMPSMRIADQSIYLATGRCGEPPKQAFVGAAITGGGNKSAVYATEVLFELARYGITDQFDVLSSVSGGSFAATLYALSCDPGECDELPGSEPPKGWQRPLWTYADASARVERNYLWPFVGKRFLPSHLYANITTHHGSDDDMADTLAERLLQQNGQDLTFAHLNPRRPNLVLNASNVTRTRATFDEDSDIPYEAKKALSDDDALHFSFTQQYFWRLLSDLDKFPLKYAVTASAAFPLIIDRTSLRHYWLSDLMNVDNGKKGSDPSYVSLWDGGVHDNFGVTELLWFVQCQFGVNARRVIWSPDIYQRECGFKERPKTRPKAVLSIGINSSLLRSEGQLADQSKHRTWDTYVLPVRVLGASDSVDMIMAASGEQRKMELRSVLEALNDPNKRDRIDPFLPRGPFQYLDIDIEALKYANCKSALDPRPLNSANGATAVTRCEELRGVLNWQHERALDLPMVKSGFCSPSDTCPQLSVLGQSKGNVLFLEGGGDTDGLINNEWLFDAVRDVPTDFELDPKYLWLLRYTARWAVAIRMWDLCNGNRIVLETISPAVALQACDTPLKPRRWNDSNLDDNVGGRVWREKFGGNVAVPLAH